MSGITRATAPFPQPSGCGLIEALRRKGFNIEAANEKLVNVRALEDQIEALAAQQQPGLSEEERAALMSRPDISAKAHHG